MSDIEPFGDYEPEPPATLEEDKPPRRRRASNSHLIYNTMALFFVAATIAACLGTLLLIQNPTLPINPFPPPSPQPTPTLFQIEAEAAGAIEPGDDGSTTDTEPMAADTSDDESAASEEAVDPTAIPTATPIPPTLTPTPPATATGAAPPPAPTNTPAAYAYTLQNETLTYIPHTGEEGCDYMAIAGQVFDVDGDPLTGIPVVVEGDDRFDAISFTGNAVQYGQSGYEVYINDSPYEAEFIVKLISDTGIQLSDEVVVRTSDSCEQNVVIVNFVQNKGAQ